MYDKVSLFLLTTMLILLDPILNTVNLRSNVDVNNDVKTTLEFSSEDSLESSMTLVSGGMSTLSQIPAPSPSTTRHSSSISSESSKSYEVTEVIVNAEKGTREKRFKDGRKEIWYSNGNRYNNFELLVHILLKLFRKEIMLNGSVKVFYYNGDLKESHPSGEYLAQLEGKKLATL